MNADIARAAEILRRGGLVAFPTETVYGLGADAESDSAVRRIFAVKGRPETHPLIVHLHDAGQVGAWAAGVPDLARRLAQRFWPGPLTIVLGRSARAIDAVTGGLDTVALRVPSHPVARELLAAFGGGIAAPSANRFGRVSPTTAQHVRDDLGADVDLVLDGGACAVGVESTIVDLSSGDPAILRPGGVTREDLERAAGRAVPVRSGGPARAPGMLEHHYAPRARVVPALPHEVAARVRELAGRRVVVLSGASVAGADHLALPAAPEDIARELYAALREVDRRGYEAVVVALPPEQGLGLAIADRLRRAAGGAS